MRMKGKMSLLNTAQEALLYIIWIVAEVMELINHWKSRWRRSQQFPIRTMLCITQNLHKREYQSLVVLVFLKSECLLWLSWAVWKSCVSLGSLAALVLGAASAWAWRSQSCQTNPSVGRRFSTTAEGEEPKATEAQCDENSTQQSSWAGLSRILRIFQSQDAMSGIHCSHGSARRISLPLEGF